MTVKELIAELKKHDPDRLVILQKDAEGNGFSPLEDVSTGAYLADSTWGGEIYLEELTPELEAEGYSSDDVAEDGRKSVVLCPVN